MPQAVSLLPFLLALLGCAFAGLNIWPSLHVALSNASVFVDFSTKPGGGAVRNTSLSLVDTGTNTTLLTRNIPDIQSAGRVEFDCSCFLYAGTFRFLLRQTGVAAAAAASRANGSREGGAPSTDWWWSSELQVQWPTFHIAVERAGNNSGSFQVGISTNEHFRACSRAADAAALFLEVSYVEFNQIGRISIDKVQARTRHPIRPLRSQSVQLSCVFPFTERDFIRVALRSPHAAQDVKSSGPLYLSRIFSYKLLVENTNAYRAGCDGTMTVRLIPPPCAHTDGKVFLYKDGGGAGRGVAVPPGMEAGETAPTPPSPPSPPLAFNWLTGGESETEFNCSVFHAGRNKYCFRFVLNLSRSPSPAQTCLVVHRSAESWGSWLPWSVCSVSCGEGVRERVRECLLPSGVGGMRCTGMVKEQSLCSLEACVALPAPSPSLAPVGVAPLGGNMVVVAGISLCLAVILATVLVTLWRKLCKTPQCSSVRGGSMHSPGGRKLSDEASIFGHSLQRPSLSDGHGPPGGVAVGVAQNDRPSLGTQPLSQTPVIPLSQTPDRLSPAGPKMLPTIFGYQLAQQQLKEMKKKGLKEATQMYHVSSSPVHDTALGTSASPTNSLVPAPSGFAPPALRDDSNSNRFQIAAPFPELPSQTSRLTAERPSPRAELVLGPSARGGSKWRDRTADWVEMVERSGFGGPRGGGGGGGGGAGMGNSFNTNPHFRRTSSFNDTTPQPRSSGHCRPFRERSLTQVGSRTLPEGSCWSKGVREPYGSYPIPEHGALEWAKPRAQMSDQRKPWVEAAAPSRSAELKTNISASAIHDEVCGARDGRRSGEAGGGGGVSGIGGPAGPSVDRAEQNWNRRGPSPIQRNILARKLKEAQSYSGGVKGRQRSSTFSVSASEQRKGRCLSLPMSGGGGGGGGGAPYRLSEAEQRMLDLDMSEV